MKTDEDIFEEGRTAYLTNTPREANPYPADEVTHDLWTSGWNDARYQALGTQVDFGYRVEDAAHGVFSIDRNRKAPAFDPFVLLGTTLEHELRLFCDTVDRTSTSGIATHSMPLRAAARGYLLGLAERLVGEHGADLDKALVA